MSTAREFLTAPIQTGMLKPSSPALARAMATAASVENRKAIVEFGPGTGVVTREIENRRSLNSQFFSIELNSSFAHQTRTLCPNVDVYEDNATNVAHYLQQHGIVKCDAIISSLPWTLINAEIQAQLLDAVAENLEPGGVFVTYLYRGTGIHPAARRFLRLLRQRVSKPIAGTTIWNNLPPARVYVAINPDTPKLDTPKKNDPEDRPTALVKPPKVPLIRTGRANSENRVNKTESTD